MNKRELQEQLDAAHAEIARLVHIGDLRKREMQQLWRLSGEMKRCQICHEPNARVYVRDSVGGAKYFCPGHVPPINGADETPDVISAAFSHDVLFDVSPEAAWALRRDEILGNLAAWGLRDGGPPDVLLDAATELALRKAQSPVIASGASSAVTEFAESIGTSGTELTYAHILRALEYCEQSRERIVTRNLL